VVDGFMQELGVEIHMERSGRERIWKWVEFEFLSWFLSYLHSVVYCIFLVFWIRVENKMFWLKKPWLLMNF
jgi:Ca2+/H+ antiporter